jgi:hypothetical protein
MRVAILTPDVFEFGDIGGSLLVRADLIRSAITRLIANVEAVEKIPGSEAVRLKEVHLSFAEIQARFEDLVHARLDPLVAVAGAGLVRESIQWVQESLRVATMQQDAAQQRANAVLIALREYSGTSTSPTPPAGGSRPPGDVQSVTPQLDKSFIDKIVELSGANTTYRQELTKQLVEASQDAVKYRTVVQHYQALMDSLSRSSTGTPLPSDEVGRRLDAIVEEAKKTTSQFDALVDEFNRVALRPPAGIYRVEQPIQTETIETFRIRYYAMIVLAVLLLAPVALALACLVNVRVRRLLQDPAPAKG